MGDESKNGWDQYSKLVLKELEVLGASVTALREEINGLRESISEMTPRSPLISSRKAVTEAPNTSNSLRTNLEY